MQAGRLQRSELSLIFILASLYTSLSHVLIWRQSTKEWLRNEQFSVEGGVKAGITPVSALPPYCALVEHF